jgi:lysozyme
MVVERCEPFEEAMMAVATNVVDLYQFDRVSNFRDAAQAGIRGIIHKATTGATGKDKKYKERRQPALDAGLLWGAYHWGTAADVKKQVDNFLKIADPDVGTLVALDFETTKGNQMTLDQAREFLERIAEKLNRKAIIYSSNVLKEALGNRNDPFFGSHRLWLAQYGPQPIPQKSWSKAWLWQFTDGKANGKPTIPGIPGNDDGEVDCDFYDGSAAQLKAEWAS